MCVHCILSCDTSHCDVSHFDTVTISHYDINVNIFLKYFLFHDLYTKAIRNSQPQQRQPNDADRQQDAMLYQIAKQLLYCFQLTGF